MARGPKRHLKRLNAPKHWMLSKLGGTWAPRPSTGPHKLRDCLPMCLILKNRLKYALTRKETQTIVMRRLVEVDGKVRTDLNYPAGFMDVISLAKTDEKFRLLYDSKGRFVLHRVKNPEEAKFKLCRVKDLSNGNKASIGRNPFHNGQAGAIPYITTNDGRTVRYPDPLVKPNDTIKLDIASGKIVGCIKFDIGNCAMITGGANKGRVGVITTKEKHPGSFDIIHLQDKRGNKFSTRSGNVFCIGEGPKPWISLPQKKGLKYSVIEEREMALKAASDKDGKKKK
jgi:small subunit ribosomal protein S4e